MVPDLYMYTFAIGIIAKKNNRKLAAGSCTCENIEGKLRIYLSDTIIRYNTTLE